MAISSGPKQATLLLASRGAARQWGNAREDPAGLAGRGGAQGAVQLEGLRGAHQPRLCGSALFKRSSGACWRNAEQEERANTAQLHFYRMLCGKTPLTHTSAWQHGLSSGPGGWAALACDHCNDLKGQAPQQAQATPAGCTAPPRGNATWINGWRV